MSHRRTLWEEGRRPGGQVVALASLLSVAAVITDLRLGERLTVVFDVAFVLVCVAAALAVRPRDFSTAALLPPLLLLLLVVALALVRPQAVADPGDGLVQAVVSGLAHHASALFTGYALALGVLALRQLARANDGRIRHTRRTRGPMRDPLRGPMRG